MRTRIFNKMTHNEVQAYLDRGGNTMYIAVGVVEVHGALPIDCETIISEAYALEMAEQSDGLAMINLPYFFPGGTVIANSTVSMSIRDGIDYLLKISRSLISQGFKKLIFISSHGPSGLTVDAACRDLFEETHIHACHIMSAAIMHGGTPDFDNKEAMIKAFDKMNKITYGAYLKMNQIDYLPVDPAAEEIPRPDRAGTAPWDRLAKHLARYGSHVSTYFEFPEDHGGGKPFASEEERLEVCTQGLKYIQEDVAGMDLPDLLDSIDEYHDYVQNVILKKYPRLAK